MKAKRSKKSNIPKMKDGRKHIYFSYVPEFRENYEGSMCWHGCDKVSVIKTEDGIVGGGGS